MMCLGDLSKKKLKVAETKLQIMDKRLKSHVSWKGYISMTEGKSILKGHNPFTYILTQGLDKYHYILHYVGADKKVYFKNVRIRYVNGLPIYRNGGGNDYENIEDLVPGCLQCSYRICKPLP